MIAIAVALALAVALSVLSTAHQADLERYESRIAELTRASGAGGGGLPHGTGVLPGGRRGATGAGDRGRRARIDPRRRIDACSNSNPRASMPAHAWRAPTRRCCSNPKK